MDYTVLLMEGVTLIYQYQITGRWLAFLDAVMNHRIL